jgi:hypothetical protein
MTRKDDEAVAFHLDLDLALEACLLKERLRDPNPLRVADAYKACFHGVSWCDHIVVTTSTSVA